MKTSVIENFTEQRPFISLDALERAQAWLKEATEVEIDKRKYRCVGGSILSAEGGMCVMASRNWKLVVNRYMER